MPTFFRRTRKGLLDEGATGTPGSLAGSYLLYAIGEILLVMIGILLALQVNNWNEERKERIQGRKYLVEVYSDLHKDVEVIATIVTRLEKQLKSAENILIRFENEEERFRDAKQFTEDELEIAHSLIPQRVSHTFDELASTGNLRILNDDSLSNRLVEYYAFYDQTLFNFDELPTFSRFELRKIGAAMSDLENAKNELKNGAFTQDFMEEFFAHPVIKGLILSIYKSAFYNIRFFGDIESRAMSIIDYIEKNYPGIRSVRKSAL